MPPIIETINKSLSSFLGIGNHQIRINDAIVKRRPINKKGGNCCIAGFAIAKPKPKSNGAHKASKIFLKLNYLVGICFFGSKKGNGTTFALRSAYGDLIVNSVSFFA